MPLYIPSPEPPVFVGNKRITGTLTLGGQTLAADGTAAAPGYAFSGAAGVGFDRQTGNIRIGQAPTATTQRGLLNLGSGPFDGATAGFFVGSANGTHLAINAASGFAGNLAEFQVAGVNTFRITAAGEVRAGTAGFTFVSADSGLYLAPGGTPTFKVGGVQKLNIGNGTVRMSAGQVFGWTSSTTDLETASDTSLGRSAAGIMAVVSVFEFPEIADPTAPAANKGRLYCRDNGSGKSQIVALFPSGAVQVIATEP